MNPRARVRLTRDAEKDLLRLVKKDPQIVRNVLKKMLLLQYSPEAGEPLLGKLIGFRKLTVGNRTYRIAWRHTVDDTMVPIVEIAEVWAVGARSNSEIYKDLIQRVDAIEKDENPETRALKKIVTDLGSAILDPNVLAEPEAKIELPQWLIEALQVNLQLSLSEISELSQEAAQKLLAAHWSRPGD